MAICVAVDCKSDGRQGKAQVFINFQGTANLKQQWFKKIKRRNI